VAVYKLGNVPRLQSIKAQCRKQMAMPYITNGENILKYEKVMFF